MLVASGLGCIGLSLRKGLAVRRRRVRAGPEGLIGHLGVVRSWTEPDGSVLVDGCLWRARRSILDDEERPSCTPAIASWSITSSGLTARGSPGRGLGADGVTAVIIILVV